MCAVPAADDGATASADVVAQGRRVDPSGRVEVAWTLRDPWEAGACLDLDLATLTGAGLALERVDVRMDARVTDLAFVSPDPSAVRTVLDVVRLDPPTPLALWPGSAVRWTLCAEPALRPVGLSVQVVPEREPGATP